MSHRNEQKINFATVFLLWFITLAQYGARSDVALPTWRWECNEGTCRKALLEGSDLSKALSLEACKMFCSINGTLWPTPNGVVNLGSRLIRINSNNIQFVNTKLGNSSSLTDAAIERFKNKLPEIIPKGVVPNPAGKSLTIYLVNKNPDVVGLLLSTNESYRLETSAAANGTMNATVSAENFFGIRHGLETLLQLMIFDDIRNEIQMVKNAIIVDKPVYPYRGILLDTSRNYYTVESIKRTIDAMASVKLNTFHWHITDTHSFPFVSKSRPELSKYGAISPSKVYSRDDIREVVWYGRARGVRVLPEFDAPAHVGEGWQFSNMTVCYRAEPWPKYCAEPPCGQLNPIQPGLYDMLESIYADMFDAFEPDIFHMGGDEVNEACWNTSQAIRDYMLQNRWGLHNEAFLELWKHFQSNAAQRVYKVNNGNKVPLVLWTSTLTNYNHVDSYLNNKDYIIQVWTVGWDPQVMGLLSKGYRIILSNYDALYLDCGFSAWIGSGNNFAENNWCSPYKGWQKVYDNSPAAFATEYRDQVLGGEAALWSEQSDGATLDGRLWPRCAALAERLWTEPSTGAHEAEQRMLHIRERLVKSGVQADSIQPEWCFQNEGLCSR